MFSLRIFQPIFFFWIHSCWRGSILSSKKGRPSGSFSNSNDSTLFSSISEHSWTSHLLSKVWTAVFHPFGKREIRRPSEKPNFSVKYRKSFQCSGVPVQEHIRRALLKQFFYALRKEPAWPFFSEVTVCGYWYLNDLRAFITFTGLDIQDGHVLWIDGRDTFG